MNSASLAGRMILICEGEPLTAADIASAFMGSGARVAVVSSVRDALTTVEDDFPCAAILDYVLGDGDTSPVRERLKERDIPFVLYSGLGDIHGTCGEAVRVSKPTSPDVLGSTVADLLQRQQARHVKPSEYEHLNNELIRVDASINAGEHRIAAHRKLMETIKPKEEQQRSLSLSLNRNLELGLELLLRHREIARRNLNYFVRQHERKYRSAVSDK